MKILSLSALLLVGTATATFMQEPQILADANLTIAYKENLSCGACVRGGWAYCINKKDKSVGFAAGDKCCDNEACVMKAWNANKDLDCGTTNPDYANLGTYYKDKYVMLQKFCARRQDSKTCCGNNGNNECKIKLKYKEK